MSELQYSQTFQPITPQITAGPSQYIGGYPQGYPPNVPQYGPPMYQPQQAFVPGVTAPLEVEYKNGASVTIPPRQQYIPGGYTSTQGGFNPATGYSTPVTMGQGFNPYSRFIGNPGYQYQQPQRQYQGGFSPYCPPPQPLYNQYNSPYGVGWCQQPANVSFDQLIEDNLYSTSFSTEEVMPPVISKIFKAKQEEAGHPVDEEQGYVISVDYYGRPVYSNSNYAYKMNQRRQKEYEEARERYIDHFALLSRISHAYNGTPYDEAAVRERFDPTPPVPPQEYPAAKNFYNYTPEERQEREKEMRVQNTTDIANRIAAREYADAMFEQKREEAYAKIKESHDKLIGRTDSEHYGLEEFLDNGYKLLLNARLQEARKTNRNGTTKYSRNNYRATISQFANTPIPITSKDEEYVSVEQTLKDIYDRNHRMNLMSIMKDSNGQVSYVPRIDESATEYEAHRAFLQAAEDKRKLNDAQRAAAVLI